MHSKSILRKDKMIWLLSLVLSSTLSTLAMSWHAFGCGLESDMNVQNKMKVNAHNLGSISVDFMTNQITRSISLPSIGFLKLSQPLDMEIMLVPHQMSISSPLPWNLWDLHFSLSWWDLSMEFSILLITLMTWLKKSLIHLTCGLRKLKNQTSHSISNQLCTMISESTLNKLSSMISTWWLRSSNSISKSPQRCKLTWFKTPECSRSSRNHSTISSRNAKEVSPMSLSSACTAEFTLQARPSSVTEAMLKKCISSDKV